MSSRHVAVLPQQGVDQITVAADGAVEEAPAAAYLRIGLVNMSGSAAGAVFTATALPELGGQNGCELRLLLPDRLMAEYGPALQEHLAEILQCEAVAQAQALEYNQSNKVGRILDSVQHTAAALNEMSTAVAAAEAPLALRRAVPPL